MALGLKIITVKNKLKENTRSICAISFQKYCFLHRPGEYPTMQNSLNGFIDILVPKAVDKGVKHGNHCGIKHRGTFFCIVSLVDGLKCMKMIEP